MYEYIKGELTTLHPTAAIIETGGIGYYVNISLQTYSIIEKQKQVTLFLHQYAVRDDTSLLYGFSSESEREMFRLLVGVSGIGANTARLILSSFNVGELASAIASEDVAVLKSVKGIGTKTAERAILELKGKVQPLMGAEGIDFSELAAAGGSRNLSEAIGALLVLGFNKNAVEKVTRALYKENPDMAAEEMIRKSLSKL